MMNFKTGERLASALLLFPRHLLKLCGQDLAAILLSGPSSSFTTAGQRQQQGKCDSSEKRLHNRTPNPPSFPVKVESFVYLPKAQMRLPGSPRRLAATAAGVVGPQAS